jgi:hypothetical protein
MAGGTDLRAMALRGFLLLMAASTLNALWLVATRGPEVAAAFPGGGSLLRPLSLALALGLLASYAGLWAWRRWGLWLAIAMSMLTIGTDIAWRAPRLHMGAALASTAVLFLLVAANRRRFAASVR